MDTKLKCLLLDDELPGLAYLKMLCGQIAELEIVKAFNDPEKLLAEHDALDFDLCISDIEMPGISGLELAQKLKGKLLIFTTAYKEHAADAFDLDAVDYITKPIRKERLEKAVAKAIEKFRKAETAEKFLTLNTDKGKAIVYLNHIVLIKTAANDSRDKEALLLDGSWLILKNINFESLAAQLPKDSFCRINKKELIAIKAVKFFSHAEITLSAIQKSSQPIVVLVSETYRPDFLSRVKT